MVKNGGSEWKKFKSEKPPVPQSGIKLDELAATLNAEVGEFGENYEVQFQGEEEIIEFAGVSRSEFHCSIFKNFYRIF